jgi:alkylation response protein AidB-like acyl-CoA dehydrogenase
MNFLIPAEILEFEREFNAYLDTVLTDDIVEEFRAHGIGPLVSGFWRRLGADGYLGLGWPVEYGGGGRSPLFLHAFHRVMGYRGLTIPLVTLETIARALMRIGSEEQKREFLPKILTAEIEFAIGYTEPAAGTDLAALAMRAERRDDYYLVNGQKVFTSAAHLADYLWLAVRTDPEAPKHRGISLLITPIGAPGIEINPLPMMADHRTNTVFCNDLRIPLSGLVGEENKGWGYITTQLNFERVAISPIPIIERAYDNLCARIAAEGGLAARPWARVVLAEIAADLYALTVMDYQIAAMLAEERVPISEASLLKVLSNELNVRIQSLAMQVLGPRAMVRREGDALLDPAGLTTERQLRRSVVNLFGGGSNDIQRDLVATFGMGLPR